MRTRGGAERERESRGKLSLSGARARALVCCRLRHTGRDSSDPTSAGASPCPSALPSVFADYI